MATSTVRNSESLHEGLQSLASLVLGIAVVCFTFTQLFSCIRNYQRLTAADEELERVRHIDQTDPATLTPHQGFPYVIADDDLCHIEITGEVYMVDQEDYHGYGHTLSECGYQFELTIVNKSKYLTIGAGTPDEPWIATGDFDSGEGENLEEGIPVSYHGFINKLGPGEHIDGSFSLFNKHRNFLYAVHAVYGSFVICDEGNRVIATYPFSYVK